jgi:hypothetical protein
VRILVLAVLALLVAPGAALAEQRFALVIGSNPGWSQDRPLRYADNDAERVRDVLVGLGGFAPDRVELLRDPSTADVRASLRRLARVAHDSTGEDTLVFVYYSGHADDNFLHLRGSEPLSHKELQETLRGLPATIKLAVVDACKSGAVTRKGGAPVDEFDVQVVSPKLSGLVLLTSSGADELSQESRALQGSVFTHHLVSGLRGAADEDGDKQVTVSEAYHYAYTRTRADTATTGAAQRPSFRYELSGSGELVLTRIGTAHVAHVTVPRGSSQRYVVLDAHEWRLIAEAQSQKDRDVVLDLAPGPYHVKRVLPDHLEVASLSLSAGDRANADQMKYESAPLANGVLKGDPTDLPPADRYEWSRSMAFGMLAEGQASGALAIFDRLTKEKPDDLLAWRGRGRALVRLAEAYQRVGNQVEERKMLTDALQADPSLGDDPLFQIWYKRVDLQNAHDKNTEDMRQKLEHDIKVNPRTVKTFGLGIDLISASGTFTANATFVIHRMVFPRFAIDIGGPGIDASVIVAPFASHWSPYIGIGGHLSARKMGIPLGGTSGAVSTNMNSFSADDMWGATARAESGMQYVASGGFTTELGLAMITFEDSRSGKVVQQLWPMFHFGWLW